MTPALAAPGMPRVGITTFPAGALIKIDGVYRGSISWTEDHRAIIEWHARPPASVRGMVGATLYAGLGEVAAAVEALLR